MNKKVATVIAISHVSVAAAAASTPVGYNDAVDLTTSFVTDSRVCSCTAHNGLLISLAFTNVLILLPCRSFANCRQEIGSLHCEKRKVLDMQSVDITLPKPLWAFRADLHKRHGVNMAVASARGAQEAATARSMLPPRLPTRAHA